MDPLSAVEKKKTFVLVGMGALAVLVMWGSGRAYFRGGNDFSVFYEAWRLVLDGRGADIYHVSPDRFLYSPGFAWLLSPLALLPREIALGIWCLGKLLVLLYLAQKFAALEEAASYRKYFFGLMIWGTLFISRPLLIDLEYGQVNLYLLWACLWGLFGHFDKEDKFTLSALDFFRWFVLSFFAVSKLFPVPLLIVPWVVTRGVSRRKLRIERIGLVFGGGASVFLPTFSLGFHGMGDLCMQWYQALLSRGLPLETHNQSFTALLNHYLSGNPIHVLSEGHKPLLMGVGWLSSLQISLLSLSWTAFTMGLTLGWILSGNFRSLFQWIAVLTGLLIIPSHLIWKPYFVFSLPMIFLLIRYLGQGNRSRPRGWLIGSLVLIFFGINFTGFDFIGHQWGAQLEAASVLLLAHLWLLILSILVGANQREPDRLAHTA